MHTRRTKLLAPAMLGKIGRDHLNQINDFIARNNTQTVRFTKDDVKEKIAGEEFKLAGRDDGLW